MERGRKEQQGVLGWGMSPCVRGEPPRLLASRDGVPLSSRVVSSSRVAFGPRVASSSPVASRAALCVTSLRVSPVFACRCRRMLSAGGGAGRLRLLVVLDPRCRPWGGPLTIPQRPRDVRGMGTRLVC